jgi:hypothetical protein
MRTEKTNLPVVSNMITDYLDYMIRANLDGVSFIAGKPVMFWGSDHREAYTPQFKDTLEEQDILDSLEALGFETDRLTAKDFLYRSDFFPDIRLVIDIVPRGVDFWTGRTNVKIRFPRPKRTGN